MPSLSDQHRDELQQAKYVLENPGLAIKMSNVLGSPVEKGLALLPPEVNRTIVRVATKSLEMALDLAISTLGAQKRESTKLRHKATAAFTGAAGGAFGLPALAVELPLSTTIMLRSIADIGRAEGENVRERDTQLACLEVFALGGPGSGDDAAESGYFSVRMGLAKVVSDAAGYLASHGASSKSAPALVNLIRQLATRFSLPVGEKVAAQAVPIIGAAGGALLNTLFIDHFQNMAGGHFVVRRLERQYDPQTIREAYLAMPSRR